MPPFFPFATEITWAAHHVETGHEGSRAYAASRAKRRYNIDEFCVVPQSFAPTQEAS